MLDDLRHAGSGHADGGLCSMLRVTIVWKRDVLKEAWPTRFNRSQPTIVQDDCLSGGDVSIVG